MQGLDHKDLVVGKKYLVVTGLPGAPEKYIARFCCSDSFPQIEAKVLYFVKETDHAPIFIQFVYGEGFDDKVRVFELNQPPMDAAGIEIPLPQDGAIPAIAVDGTLNMVNQVAPEDIPAGKLEAYNQAPHVGGRRRKNTRRRKGRRSTRRNRSCRN
jgi:hypothetical protein